MVSKNRYSPRYLNTALNTMEAGAGATSGTGTVYRAGVSEAGGIITTQIMIDLTGLSSSTTDLDVIGVGTDPAHIGQITESVNGTILGGYVTCLETPAGGITDIDVYSAPEGTGAFDSASTALTELIILTSGGAWAEDAGVAPAITGVPAAEDYLYLMGGAAGTAAAYTAGILVITLYGYHA